MSGTPLFHRSMWRLILFLWGPPRKRNAKKKSPALWDVIGKCNPPEFQKKSVGVVDPKKQTVVFNQEVFIVC